MATPSLPELSAQVEKICQNKPLNKSERGIQLLTYLVNTLLQGANRDGIKESVIGVDVFGLALDYDPKKNAIVRVSIGKLRQNLSQYYETLGREDAVKIEIDVGTYVPKFSYQTLVSSLAIFDSAALNIANAKAALENRTKSDYARALKYLNRALAQHPKHPRILSLKAMAHAGRAMYGGDPRSDLTAAAVLVEEAKKIEQAKGLSYPPWERLLVEAWLRMTLQFDWKGAESLFKAAIELSRSEARYHTWYSAYLFSQLRMTEGLALVEAAITHGANDNSFRRADLALCQVISGKLMDAAETLDIALELFPQAHYILYLHQAILAEARGDYARANDLISRVPVSAEESTLVSGLRCFFLGLSGDIAGARKAYAELVAVRSIGRIFMPALQLAGAAVGAQHEDEAVQWFKVAIEERDPLLSWIAVLPFARHMHRIPRLRTLITGTLKLKIPKFAID